MHELELGGCEVDVGAEVQHEFAADADEVAGLSLALVHDDPLDAGLDGDGQRAVTDAAGPAQSIAALRRQIAQEGRIAAAQGIQYGGIPVAHLANGRQQAGQIDDRHPGGRAISPNRALKLDHGGAIGGPRRGRRGREGVSDEVETRDGRGVDVGAEVEPQRTADHSESARRSALATDLDAARGTAGNFRRDVEHELVVAHRAIPDREDPAKGEVGQADGAWRDVAGEKPDFGIGGGPDGDHRASSVDDRDSGVSGRIWFTDIDELGEVRRPAAFAA